MDITDNNQIWNRHFAELSTPFIADACLRLKLPFRTAAVGIHSLTEDSHIAGQVLPVRHYGSVDIFLESMGSARRGDILVIDNSGRTDEACIGDLTALEARAHGLAGMIVWGCHRDTAELKRIGFPVFSYGANPAGPERLDARDADALITARFGRFTVSRADAVFADADGVIFVPSERADDILAMALSISMTERRQADAILSGRTLRQQLRFDEYLAKREKDATYTFRQHLRTVGGAIEE